MAKILSKEELKAKADLEILLDKLQKVSRDKIRKVEQNIQDFGKRIGVLVHFVRQLLNVFTLKCMCPCGAR